jgi:hypothetical protein
VTNRQKPTPKEPEKRFRAYHPPSQACEPSTSLRLGLQFGGERRSRHLKAFPVFWPSFAGFSLKMLNFSVKLKKIQKTY